MEVFGTEIQKGRFVRFREGTERGAESVAVGWICGEGFHGGEVSDPRLRRAGERFARFVRESFGGGEGRLSLAVRDGMAGSRTEVAGQEIRVEAGDVAELMQALYALQDRMEELETPVLPAGVTERRTVWSPRYLYSYFALYGDPLMEPEADPFPDGYWRNWRGPGLMAFGYREC